MNKSLRRSRGPAATEEESGDMATDSVQGDWQKWTVDDVINFLQLHNLNEEADIFKREEIDGPLLPKITEERLEKMGVGPMGKRMKLMEKIHSVVHSAQSITDNHKVFNDPVHGHIDFHPLLVKIIDTPQFQRLRFIKQLGCSYFVFPGAANNRFEHSLGVCFLAGELVAILRRKQPELQITAKDLLCVQIAGLCHDLGHGPFSHMFDLFFIPQVRPDIEWKHEHLSVRMFDHLIEVNNLRGKFEEYGLDEKDMQFIREQIEGPPKAVNSQNGEKWLYRGRDKEKSFLYEVVANKRNGIDVDKWDYFARDCHNLGISNSFDHWRFMSFAKVIEVDGQKQICSRDKEVGNLYDMFHTRNTLHRRAYQHKVNKIIETMIVEALVKADPHLRMFPGANGKPLTMSESLDDMHAYTLLTDSVFEFILISQDPKLEPSKAILHKILKRQLYKCVGQLQPPSDAKLETPLEISKQICLAIPEEELGAPQLDPDDLVVHVVKMDYGMGNQNPVDYVRFYSKEDPSTAVKIRKGQVSQMLPVNFMDHHIRIFCKHRDIDSVNKAMRCIAAWCEQKGFRKPRAGNFLDPAMTPHKRPGDETDSQDSQTPKKSRKNLEDEY